MKSSRAEKFYIICQIKYKASFMEVFIEFLVKTF